MELDTKNIIELHKIDKRLDQIEETKGDLPSIIDEQEETLNNLHESIKACDEKINELNKEKNADKISIDEQKASIDKYNTQIFQVKNNKEYDAILKEIDHIEVKHKELLSKAINLDEEISNQEELKKNCEEKTSSLEGKLVDYKEELNIVSVETKSEEKKLSNNKEKIIESISDKDFLNKYSDSESNSIVSSVSRGSCDNCFSGLPDQLYLDVQKGTKLYSCPDCGIYLYYDELEEEE